MREDALALELEVDGVDVEPRWNGRRAADVGIEWEDEGHWLTEDGLRLLDSRAPIASQRARASGLTAQREQASTRPHDVWIANATSLAPEAAPVAITTNCFPAFVRYVIGTEYAILPKVGGPKHAAILRVDRVERRAAAGHEDQTTRRHDRPRRAGDANAAADSDSSTADDCECPACRRA